jgi:DNA-binding FadR family transcriptional regulator
MGEPERDNVRPLGSRDRVLTGLQEWILNEHLRVGDELPPVRDLARSLGVGKVSVREAFRVLESLGVLEPRATGEVVAAPVGAWDALLRLHVSLSGFSCGDLMRTRIELERSSAAKAAVEARPEELRRLRSMVDSMAGPATDHRRFRELDCAFHLGLARAAHNDLAAVLLAGLGNAVKQEMSAGYARSMSWPGTADRLAAEHRLILDSVAGGDPGRAAERVTQHIAAFYDLRTTSAGGA